MTCELILDSWETDIVLKASDIVRVVGYDGVAETCVYSFDREELIEDARKYMKTLSKRQARICDMYYTVGHSQAEIAEIENMTISAVDMTLRRVSKKLRERYGT